MSNSPFIIGNSFPFSLVRRHVELEILTIDELREALSTRPWSSFWGHNNTIAAANPLLGIDVTPATERPAVTLANDKRPRLNGTIVSECMILSPNYTSGFRPAINEEVPAEKILTWEVIQMLWT